MPHRSLPLLAGLLGLAIAAPACESPPPPEAKPRPTAEPGMATGDDVARIRPAPRAAPEPAPVGPRISDVVVDPDPPLAVDDVRARVVLEGGGDTSALDMDFEWSVNGRQVYGRTRDVLPAGNYKRGDVIAVKVQVADADGRTAAVERGGLVVGNANPRILTDFGSPRFRSFDGLRIEAEDPDGDPLTYALESPPPGFSIEKESGRIRVRKGKYPGGVYETRIVVRDPHGGEAAVSVPISMTIGEEAKVEEATTSAERRVSDMDDAEHEKRYSDTTERIEKMTDEELDRFVKEREAAGR